VTPENPGSPGFFVSGGYQTGSIKLSFCGLAYSQPCP
jgi:hypothetical protein